MLRSNALQRNAGQHNAGLRNAGQRNAGQRNAGQPARAMNFFEELPADDFLPAEAVLRDRLITSMQREWKQNSVAKLMQFQDVAEAVNELLPRGASMLFEWVERRLGQDMKVRRDARGRCGIQLIQTLGEELARQEEVETFLGSLPADSFTKQEAALRDAVLRFVKHWQGSGPPRLCDVGNSLPVKSAREAFLPPNINLMTWLEARVGNEFELLQDAAGQYAIGLPGALDPEQVAASVVRNYKRKANAL
eukprot:gnl/TRDRNA2_/TRDRNA2_137163_c0_seq1.p1 gnl/TRDRNA2_/TRDRNA2_137163_c0~~gnl/TRDRNA2_/TRDRNA2_137163_c0_seq1.p1  ORF type:complete len:249 (+),score=37.92 gnl/TRDRNA2_/TRDRNA2_137163_c0_seq1:40-786(+)